jgi:hypothetical protein
MGIFFANNMFPRSSKPRIGKEQRMKTVTTIKAAPGFNEAGKRISKLRVCAYCRVSTMHEEQQNSFDAQIRHYAMMMTIRTGSSPVFMQMKGYPDRVSADNQRCGK